MSAIHEPIVVTAEEDTHTPLFRYELSPPGGASSQMLNAAEVDEVWSQLGWQLLRQLNLSCHVPSPSLNTPPSKLLSLTAVFYKLTSQSYLSGGESRYCCLGPLFTVIDMARSDTERLRNQLLRSSHKLPFQDPVNITLGGRCRYPGSSAAVQLGGLRSARVNNVDQLSDVYVDFSAAQELRGVERLYLISEIVSVDWIQLEVDNNGAKRRFQRKSEPTVIAFVYKKYRLTSHGLIARPLSTPVGVKQRSYFQRSTCLPEDSPATEVLSRDHDTLPNWPAGAVHSEVPKFGTARRYVMMYARPISMYTDCTVTDKSIAQSPLASSPEDQHETVHESSPAIITEDNIPIIRVNELTHNAISTINNARDQQYTDTEFDYCERRTNGQSTND